MVGLSEGRFGLLEFVGTDAVESFVVDHHTRIGLVSESVQCQNRVLWLNYDI